MPRAYYNEIEPYAAEWLRNLILCELIADGDVDTRSIEDVRPVDLAGYTQCHFFAGIGVWSWALRAAGVPDSVHLWTGSCPCPGFSTAGKRQGFNDPRHLWPAWYRLIDACRPPLILGEQVASNGSAAHRAAMQQVWSREAFEGVLHGKELLDGLPPGLQDVHSHPQSVMGSGEPGTAIRNAHRLPPEEPGARPAEPGEISGAGQGHRVRPGRSHAGASADHRPGALPADGPAAEPGRGQDVGQPLSGQDRLDAGVHTQQRAGGPLLRERDGQHLGARQDPGDRASDPYETGTDGPVGSPVVGARREVEGESGIDWVALVQSDLERSGYACGAAVTPACGFGAPHIRQRLYFAAHPLADAAGRGCGVVGGAPFSGGGGHVDRSSEAGGFWAAAEWVRCRDGKQRPFDPQSFPLAVAHGVTAGVGSVCPEIPSAGPRRTNRLRGYGNAICAPAAIEWIRCVMECMP